MSATSKTGLLPSVKKKISMEVQVKETILEVPNFAIPAPFTLRPFAGIYNPFPYRCSVLCNHPADFEAKSMVKKARDIWALEGKSLLDAEECAALKSQRLEEIQHSKLESADNAYEAIPKTVFNNYEGPDSRPLTPAPTLASITTKSSQNLRGRRCFTPDPTPLFPAKEKTLLLLDLRRSHSQDTSAWQGDQMEDSGLLYFNDELDENLSREASPKRQKVVEKKKKINRKLSESFSRTVSNSNSKDSDSKITTQHSSRSQSPSKISSVVDKESTKSKSIHPEETQESSSSDQEVIKRRGKKKKGKKSGKGGLGGDKEFKGIPDPGETQISALNGESKENSSRTSVSEEEEKTEKSNQNDVIAASGGEPFDSDFEDDSKSFLNSSILKQLQRQLDQEVIDSEMDIKRRIALEEALRLKKESKLTQQREEMKNLKKEFLPVKNLEEWLKTPRAFSRQSARFELPMDSRLLNDMTPLQYVQGYIFPSAERLVLYNYVFNLHMEELEEDGDQDRKLQGKNVVPGLNEVMGKDLTPKQAKDFQELIGWKDEVFMNFRTFAGISAACERLLAPQFCKMPSQTEDPRHKIERADFETLDEKLFRLKPDKKLVHVLKSVRDL